MKDNIIEDGVLVTFIINEEIWNRFKEVAKAKGLSASSLLRLLIIEYLEKEK